MGNLGNEIIGKEAKKVDSLTKEGLMERKRLTSFRNRVSTALLGLCLVMHCGEVVSDKIVEGSAKKSELGGFPKECASEDGENLAKDFLGRWVGKLNQWENEAYLITEGELVSKPSEAILLDGKKALLCLPISISGVSYGKNGGIYRWGDKFCMIQWCDSCKQNIVIPLKKEGDVIQLGMPNKNYSLFGFGIDRNTTLDDRMNTMHDEQDFHYNPKTWIEYKRVTQNPTSK